MMYEKFHPELNGILKEAVFQDLTSENEYLKYRACWMYGMCSRIPTEDEHRLEAGKILFRLMHDDENMAIKITSSTSLYKNLRNETMKEAFKSELSSILEAYLGLMDTIDNEELISGLEEVVSIYDDCIEPFAIVLCEKIVENFKKMTEQEKDEGEFGTSGMATSGLVVTIRSIINSCKNNVEVLLKIEPVIFPMVVNSLTPDG